MRPEIYVHILTTLSNCFDITTGIYVSGDGADRMCGLRNNLKDLYKEVDRARIEEVENLEKKAGKKSEVRPDG